MDDTIPSGLDLWLAYCDKKMELEVAQERIDELEKALKHAAHDLDMEGLEIDYVLAALGEKKDG